MTFCLSDFLFSQYLNKCLFFYLLVCLLAFVSTYLFCCFFFFISVIIVRRLVFVFVFLSILLFLPSCLLFICIFFLSFLPFLPHSLPSIFRFPYELNPCCLINRWMEAHTVVWLQEVTHASWRKWRTPGGSG